MKGLSTAWAAEQHVHCPERSLAAVLDLHKPVSAVCSHWASTHVDESMLSLWWKIPETALANSLDQRNISVKQDDLHSCWAYDVLVCMSKIVIIVCR